MIEYTIKRSNRKTLVLSVNKDGVTVKAPLKTSLKVIEDFVRKKESWIMKNLQLYKNKTYYNQSFEEGEVFLLCGRLYKIAYADLKTVQIDGICKTLTLPNNFKSDAKSFLTVWLKKFAKKLLEERLQALSNQMQMPFFKFYLSSARRRWGSCNVKKEIRLNYRLAFCPEDVIDYVIIHELSHLVEMNHSKRFWAVVEHYMPRWKEKRKWLKDNSQLIDF